LGNIGFVGLFSQGKIVNCIFSEHLVVLGGDVGQIWRNQAKMHESPEALTGANAYFAKKIQARGANAQQTEYPWCWIHHTSKEFGEFLCRWRTTPWFCGAG